MALLQVKDIQEITGLSQSAAYALMKQLRDEMRKAGYVVLHGKIEERYFMERLGLSEKGVQTKCSKQ